MFPTGFVETTTEETTEKVGVDFLFDYKTGQHLMSDMVLAECSTLQTAEQFIQNVLRTAANAFKVYTKDESDVFGITVFDYIGQRSLPMGYINSELKREVTEQLLEYPLIADVSNWVGKRERRGLNVSFTVTLTDGTIIEETQTVTAYYTPTSSQSGSVSDDAEETENNTESSIIASLWSSTVSAVIMDNSIISTDVEEV